MTLAHSDHLQTKTFISPIPAPPHPTPPHPYLTQVRDILAVAASAALAVGGAPEVRRLLRDVYGNTLAAAGAGTGGSYAGVATATLRGPQGYSYGSSTGGASYHSYGGGNSHGSFQFAPHGGAGAGGGAGGPPQLQLPARLGLGRGAGGGSTGAGGDTNGVAAAVPAVAGGRAGQLLEALRRMLGAGPLMAAVTEKLEKQYGAVLGHHNLKPYVGHEAEWALVARFEPAAYGATPHAPELLHADLQMAKAWVQDLAHFRTTSVFGCLHFDLARARGALLPRAGGVYAGLMGALAGSMTALLKDLAARLGRYVSR